MILLSSELFEVKEIKKKTRAEGFKDLEVGDQLRFSMPLKNTTNWGRGNYASVIKIEDVKRGTVFFKSQSELLNILDRSFEIAKGESL